MIPFGPGFPIPPVLDWIKSFESCKLTSYKDSNGIWTIGWGHTGPEVHDGLVWTQAEADAALVKDLGDREVAVAKLFTHAQPTYGQLLACTSLTYNIGLEAFKTSHLLALINQNSLAAAALEFARWDHVGPSDNRGLLQRRLAEAMCFVRDSSW